jgi:hypothetical protein
MKRWALATTAVYTVSIIIMSLPFLLVHEDATDFLPQVLAWIFPVLIFCQAMYLLVPMNLALGRPIRRRRVIVSVIFGAIPMAAMVLCLSWCITLLIFGEKDDLYDWPALTVPAFFWIASGVLFYRFYRSDDPQAWVSRVGRWLLTSGTLAFIVAVPSHIISRRKEDCCAPGLTLLGMVTGLAVAVMAFGPGLFFLFARKVKDKRKAVELDQ